MIMSNMMYIPLAAFQPLCVPPILSLSLLKKDWCLQTSYLSISSLFYILRGDQFVCTSSVDFQKSLKKKKKEKEKKEKKKRHKQIRERRVEESERGRGRCSGSNWNVP